MPKLEVVVTGHDMWDRLHWKDRLVEVLLESVGGVSIYEGTGDWRSPETGVVISEPHFLLRVFTDDAQVLFYKIRHVLEGYRIQAKQEAVMVIIDGTVEFLTADTDQVVTDPRFWDCECVRLYIHNKRIDTHCDLCGAKHEDQPDSRVNEIAAGGKFATDDSWLVAYNMSEYYNSLDEFDSRKYKRFRIELRGVDTKLRTGYGPEFRSPIFTDNEDEVVEKLQELAERLGLEPK